MSDDGTEPLGEAPEVRNPLAHAADSLRNRMRDTTDERELWALKLALRSAITAEAKFYGEVSE